MTHSKSIQKLFLVSLVLFLASCTTDEDIVEEEAISDEEAVELIAGSVQTSTAGITLTVNSFSRALSTEITQKEICGNLYEKTIPYNTIGNVVEADYILAWSYQVNCNSLNIPQTVLFKSSTVGTYSTQRIESDGSSHSSYTISGLQPSADYYVFNGEYSQDATHQVTANQNSKNITSTVYFKLTDIIAGKESYEISSGTGTFTLTGTTDQGSSFSMEGTISFIGNGKATVTLNGTAFEISLG